MNRIYGWRPDLGDVRDYTFSAPRRIAPLPSKFSLAGGFPANYDQGSLGSCTANAIAGAIEFDRKKQGLPRVMPSRLFIYYQERLLENSVEQDAGATIRDSMRATDKFGYPKESLWPYKVQRFAQLPPVKAYKDAEPRIGLLYQRVPRTLSSFRRCLFSGFPIVHGISVYSSFESQEVASTGTVPMPTTLEELLGGHAIAMLSYDDKTEEFGERNSWGRRWGRKGNFTLPYDYVMDPNLADDFWTVTLVKA